MLIEETVSRLRDIALGKTNQGFA
jgi:chromosome segregation ATPase